MVRRYPFRHGLRTKVTKIFAFLWTNRKITQIVKCQLSSFFSVSRFLLFYDYYCHFPPIFHSYSPAFCSVFPLSFSGWLWLIKGSFGIYSEVIFCFVLFWFVYFFLFTNMWHECLRKKELFVFIVLIKHSLLKIGLLELHKGLCVSWFILVGT